MMLVFHERPGSIVFVVDDDPSVRSAIKRLIVCVGLQVELFESAQEFLASKLPNTEVTLSDCAMGRSLEISDAPMNFTQVLHCIASGTA